jgi:hypothetical protein
MHEVTTFYLEDESNLVDEWENFYTVNLMFCWPFILIYPHNINQQVEVFSINSFQY